MSAPRVFPRPLNSLGVVGGVINSMCKCAESKFFNSHTNIFDDKFVCFGVKGLMDSNKNFDDNKLYLDERFNDEPNGKVRELLLKDKTFLDDIQVQMSTAREFLFVVRLRNESDEESFPRLNRIEKCINEQGFNCKRADKDDTKRVIARYFGVKTNDETIEDHDGDKAAEKWIIPD